MLRRMLRVCGRVLLESGESLGTECIRRGNGVSNHAARLAQALYFLVIQCRSGKCFQQKVVCNRSCVSHILSQAPEPIAQRENRCSIVHS